MSDAAAAKRTNSAVSYTSPSSGSFPASVAPGQRGRSPLATSSTPRSAPTSSKLSKKDEDDDDDDDEKEEEEEQDNDDEEEDEDDDEDEDEDNEDDDDDDKDTTKSKRGAGGRKGADTTRWTTSEQAEVLDFYGLDTLIPRTWVDLRERSADAAAAAAITTGTVTKPSTSSSTRASQLMLNRVQTADASGSNKPSSNAKTAYLHVDGKVLVMDTSDPLGIRDSIIRRNKRRESTKPVHSDTQSIFISEKSFNASYFLREVHKTTSYRDLEQGAIRLKSDIEQRNETVKNMVKKHFAKFVNAKSTIDSFYREMRQKNLVSSLDYGVAPFSRALEALEKNANKLYGPILGRRSDGDKIRIALSILEGWKFFFNLPSSLNEQIKRLKYDGAVRDYKKGKSLMVSSFGEDAVGAGAAAAAAAAANGTAGANPGRDPRVENRREKDPSLALLPKTHRAVFEKVWAEVERIIGLLRDELFTKLGDPSHSIDAQEKIIGHLVDLDVDKSPVWCFLESQYQWFVDRIKSCYRVYAAKVVSVAQERSATSPMTPKAFNDMGLSHADSVASPMDAARSLSEKPADAMTPILETPPTPTVTQNIDTNLNINTNIANHKDITSPSTRPRIWYDRPVSFNTYEFKKGLACIASRNFEILFRNNDDAQAWRLTLRFVQELCSVIYGRLPDLCKICRTFVEGRLHRVKGTDNDRKTELNRRAQRVSQMLRNILILVSTVLADAFGLHLSYTDIANMFKGDADSAMNAHGQSDRTFFTAFLAMSVPGTTMALYDGQLFSGAESATTTGSCGREDTMSTPGTQELTEEPPKIETMGVADISDIPIDPHRHFYLISHPLIIAHYAIKTISVLEQTYEDIRSIGLFSQDETLLLPLSLTFTHLQSRVIECICESLVTVSGDFHRYEDWTYETSSSMSSKSSTLQGGESTTTVRLFYRFHRFMLRAVGHLYSTTFYSPVMLEETHAGVATSASTGMATPGLTTPSSLAVSSVVAAGVSGNQRAIHMPQRLLRTLRQHAQDKIRIALFESHYLFLDGLQWLVTGYRHNKRKSYIYGEDTDVAIHNSWVEAGVTDSGLDDLLPSAGPAPSNERVRSLPSDTLETRCFIVLGNIAFLRTVAIPKLTKLFETRLNTHATTDIQHLIDTTDCLDTILVRNYVRRQSIAIDRLIQSGILFSGLDWKTLAKTQDVRQYCHHILLHLVLVHAAIVQVSRVLLRPVMAEMFVALACGLLTAYRAVDKFSIDGMLQATLETEFLHHTLKAYETPQSSTIMTMVYDTIERNTEKSATQSTASMNEKLLRVKTFLEQAKSSTIVQFLCFHEDDVVAVAAAAGIGMGGANGNNFDDDDASPMHTKQRRKSNGRL